ncbi:hypothetical protein [Streptomyces zagrosensis]|uniref:SpdD protein n=1 Tax=Streptomyces zagrosensis TaxID=1042984 RepID=A0A7W9Q8G5_9ACTN|nr:hypothetical protein [Streptomyces zagrosensis]MBB5934477.1 hypothetical protein [Streptomyces zagrosensis]
MFRPKYPQPPASPTSYAIDHATRRDRAPACSCQQPAPPSPARRIAPSLSVGAGTVAAVVTIGIVLTALLAAVAIAAVSVALAAVVIRTLLTGQHHRHR